jgi:hypothetical protein
MRFLFFLEFLLETIERNQNRHLFSSASRFNEKYERYEEKRVRAEGIVVYSFVYFFVCHSAVKRSNLLFGVPITSSCTSL